MPFDLDPEKRRIMNRALRFGYICCQVRMNPAMTIISEVFL
jgi:hypothetical protein